MAKQNASEAVEVFGPAIRVLLVDNERDHAEAMSEALERVGYECTVATSGPEGARKVEEQPFDLVVTDLMMNDIDGMGILSRTKEHQPECQVIMITGHGTVPRAVEAMQLGAYTFIEKPITSERLRAAAEKAVAQLVLERKNLELSRRLDERFGFEGIIAVSDLMKKVIERLKRIAPTDAGVLIRGDSGTGKELVAQAIHQNSPRKNKPFVALNCGAVAEHLVESELFGHVKGAFTDALSDRVGKFEYANGGTLFLDEVGDMPAATQIKLLRVLEEREITRVGDNKPIKVNVRVLSATNRDLEDAIRDGSFRNDLYYRLKVVTVDLPPLADRREDIVPLVDAFRRQFARRHQKTVKNVSPAVMRRFFDYDWPGNVRQLRNVVENMVVLDIDEVLDLDDLPPDLEVPAKEIDQQVNEGPGNLIGCPMDVIERWAITETLKLTNGNREEAARILGIGARTLYRKLDKYGKD
ncbi:MAG: sigma-54 dependent transcriptional regulator [Pirellulaceae bacterium]